MMYKTSVLLAISLSACSQDSYIIDDRILAKYTIYDNFNESDIIMGTAILSNTNTLSAISQETMPAIVFILSNKNLDLYLKSKGLGRNGFMYNKNLLRFLKSHIIDQEFVSSGDYTSLGGDVWRIEGGAKTRPISVNGVSITICFEAASYQKAVNKGLICYIDRPLVDLQ